MKKEVKTDKAPTAIGPYSQAVIVGDQVYTSGIIPIIPETGVIPESIEEQARTVFLSLKNLLEASGASLKNVIKTTLFIKNMDDFSKINEIYADFFSELFPARSCVEVSRLPKDVFIEIEATAYITKI